MQKSVTVRFVPPTAVKVPITTATVHTREWNVDKLLDHLRTSLEPQLQAELGEDVEVEVVAARQPDIRLNNVKPRGSLSDWKESVGEAIGEVMGGVDPEDFLSP